jgi:PAS domain S-box-containing protein
MHSEKVLSNSDFAHCIELNLSSIETVWIDRVKSNISAAKVECEAYIRDHVPQILHRLVEIFKGETEHADFVKGLELAQSHGFQRSMSPNYSLSDLALEFALLRETILDHSETAGTLSAKTFRLFSRFMEGGLLNATKEFLTFSQHPDPVVDASNAEISFAQANVGSRAQSVAKTLGSDPIMDLKGHKYALEIALSSDPIRKLLTTVANEIEMELGDNVQVCVSLAQGQRFETFAPSLDVSLVAIIQEQLAKAEVNGSLVEEQLNAQLSSMYAKSRIAERFESVRTHLVPSIDPKICIIVTILQFRAKGHRPSEDNFLSIMKKTLKHVVDRRVENSRREDSEKNAKRSSEELSTMLRSIGDAVISVSSEDGRPILFMNRVAEVLTGITMEDAVGRPVADVFKIINRVTRKAAKSPIEDALQTKSVQILEKDTLLIAKDGSEYEIEDSAAPIENNEGEITGVVLVFRDVTKQKELEQTARKAQENVILERKKFRYLVDNAIAGMCIYSGPDHIYEYVNDEYIKILGARDYIGRKGREVVPEAQEQGLYDILDKVYATGEPYVGREVSANFRRPANSDGQEGIFDFVFQPLKEGSRIIGTTVMFIEVTDRVRAKVEFENQQKWLYSVLNSLPVPLFLTEPKKNRIFFMNDASRAMIPRDLVETLPNERHGKGKIEVYDHKQQLVDTANIPSARASRGEIMNGDEFRLLTDGRDFEAAAYSRIVPASFGHEDVAILLLLDISQRKNAERAARERDAIFHATFAHSSIGLALTDLNGRFQEVNPSFEKLSGWNSEELKSLDILGITHPDDVERKKLDLAKLISGEVSAFQIEKRYLKKDGSTVWVRNSVSLNRDQFDRPTNIILVSEDISVKRKFEMDLKESESRFRTLADAMPQIVWTARNDGVLDYSNKRASEYLGGQEPHLWLDSVHPDDAARVLPIWMHSVHTGEPYEVEFRIKRQSDSAYRWHLVRAMPAYASNHEIERWYGTCTDISESRELSSQKDNALKSAELANNAKSAFLANMSHEIRTPLGAIMGFVELLKDESLTRQDTHDYLGVIERNSTQLLRIIDDILDLSKVEAGKMLIEHIDFSLLEVLADFSSLMGFRARENGIDFKVTAQTEIPDPVNSDPTRIRQILNNVVGNAIKFTQKGKVELFVLFEDNYLTFRVVDTGRGITKEQAAELFQPFSQADVSTTRKFGGTGLGLVLTKKLCEALGGDFWLEHSELGVGSTFVARFQVSVPLDSKMIRGSRFGFTTEPARSALARKQQLAGMKILVVEDSPDNQMLLRVLITRSGGEVVLASDGFEGVEKAISAEFDVVIMDVQMPRMDGYEAVKELRSRGFSKPIIALTAHAMKEEKEKCLEAGYSEFLSKPIDQTALVELVRTFRNE